MEKSTEIININLLGEFKLYVKETNISADMNRSKKMWQMLEYLIVHRNRRVSNEELIELLWGREKVKGPENALKTLSYRLRKMLESLNVPYARELIQTVEGGYSWQSYYPCRVDIAVFEDLCLRGKNKAFSDEERRVFLEEAIQLYKGNFFVYTGLEHCMMPFQAYYYNLWNQSVCYLMGYLQKQGDFDKVIELCKECLVKDGLNEQIQYYFIEALLKKNRLKEVISYYQSLSLLFNKELGVAPGNKIRGLYLEALEGQQIEKDNIEEVSIRRGGQEKQNYKLLVGIRKNKEVEGQEDTLIFQEKMEILSQVILNNKRVEDKVARKEIAWFEILPVDITLSQGQRIAQRIKDNLPLVLQKEFQYKIKRITKRIEAKK